MSTPLAPNVLCYIVTMGVLRHHHHHQHEQDGHGSVAAAAASEDDDDEKEHPRFTTRHHHHHRRRSRSSTLTDIERRSSNSSLHHHHHHRNHHHHHHDHGDNDKPPSLRHHPTLTSLERKLTDAERNLGRTLTTVEHTAERTVSEIAGLDNVDDPRPISSFLHEAAHLNFYRVHLLIFTFTPLIFSGIFYASNGPSPENQIAYVDALFMCTSAMAVTGLNSVLLAFLTTWQQFIIFVRPFCLVPVSFLGRAFRERERRWLIFPERRCAHQFLTSIGSTSFVSIIVIGIRRCVLLLARMGA